MSQELRLQTLVLASVLSSGTLQSLHDGSSATIILALGSLACGAFVLALAKGSDGGPLKYLGAAMWAGKITLSLAMVFGLIQPPAFLKAQGLLIHVGFFVMCMVFQRHAGQLLPLWAVLPMAEVHSLAHWVTVSTDRFFLRLVLSHLAGIVLPTLLLHRNKLRRLISPAAGSGGGKGGAQAACGSDQPNKLCGWQHQPEQPVKYQPEQPGAAAGAAGAAAAAFDNTDAQPPPMCLPDSEQALEGAVDAGLGSGDPGGIADGVRAAPGHAAEGVDAGPTGGTADGANAGPAHGAVITPRRRAVPGQAIQSWLQNMAAATADSGTRSSLSQLPHPSYLSELGKSCTVCIKIATHHHPDSLPPGALNNLARAVERLGSSGQAMVFGASVRHGCILISLDMRCTSPFGVGLSSSSPPAGGDSSGQDSSSPAAAATAEALACAQQLLPELMQTLGLWEEGAGGGGGKRAAQVLGPGQYLSLQLGGQVVHATIDPHSGEWVFTTQALQWEDVSSSLPQLCLAQPCRPPPPQPAVTGQQGSSSALMHAVAFQVQLRCNVPGQPQGVVGSCPRETYLPAPGQPLSKSPGLQLWVHCQGQYLHTVVEPADATSSAASRGSGAVPAAVLQAVVQLPSTALARHHQPGGPAARLQLLTAELWSGDRLLSSTPLLLDADQHLQPAARATEFGWWGASAAAAAGLVHEVAALTADMQQQAGGAAVTASTQSHAAFVSDLAAWLMTMQHAAPGTCCDMCVVDPLQQHSGLGLGQCKVLARHLQAHAAACKLPMTGALLRSQRAAVLGPWQHSSAYCSTGATSSSGSSGSSGSGSSSGGGSTAAARTLRLAGTIPQQLWQGAVSLSARAMRTWSCPPCDRLYYARLRAYLRRVWVSASVVRVVVGCIFVSQQIQAAGEPLYICIMAAYTALHLLSLLVASIGSVTAAPDVGTQARANRTASATSVPKAMAGPGGRNAVLAGTQAMAGAVPTHALPARDSVTHDTLPGPVVVAPPGWLSRCKRWLVQEDGFRLLAWFARLLLVSCISSRVCAQPACARPNHIGPYMATDAVFVLLTEQMHAWGRLPGWAVACLAVFEFLNLTQSVASCDAVVASSWPVRVGYPAASLLLPVLMNRHWRGLLSHTRPKAPTTRAAGSCLGDDLNSTKGTGSGVHHAHAD